MTYPTTICYCTEVQYTYTHNSYLRAKGRNVEICILKVKFVARESAIFTFFPFLTKSEDKVLHSSIKLLHFTITMRHFVVGIYVDYKMLSMQISYKNSMFSRVNFCIFVCSLWLIVIVVQKSFCSHSHTNRLLLQNCALCRGFFFCKYN